MFYLVEYVFRQGHQLLEPTSAAEPHLGRTPPLSLDLRRFRIEGGREVEVRDESEVHDSAAERLDPIGGLGHTLPFLIPHFNLAIGVAVVVVIVELAVISWIRHHYMDTPLTSAVFQVVVGGVLVFLTGILIGSS